MERLNEEKILKLAKELEFQPLEIKINEPVSGPQDFRFDAFADIKWENNKYKFVVVFKNQATPKLIESLTYQLKSIRNIWKNNGKAETYYPLLIAPYLNEVSLMKLADQNISGIDLSGNGLVIVPGKLFVYRFGEKNKFPSSAPIKNVFRGVSSIVSRVLFTKPEFENATEILDEITERSGKTSLATVSKVLKTLEEDLIISRKDKIRLIDAKLLLKNLRENYRKPSVDKRIIGKVENLDDTLIKMSDNAEEKDLLFAVNEPQRYSIMPSGNPVARVYTQNINETLTEVDFSEQERFSNIEIIETQDQTVYFDRRYELGVGCYFTSPLQVYLELANSGKREKETAEQLEEGLLNYRY